MNAKTSQRQTIKMVAFNPITRKWNEVFPEDEVTTERMVPMFWDKYDEKFMTCPDVPVAQVYGEWLAQVGG